MKIKKNYTPSALNPIIEFSCWQEVLPFHWVDSYGSGFIQALGNDNIAERAIQPGHLNDVKALVSPVNISYKSKGI